MVTLQPPSDARSAASASDVGGTLLVGSIASPNTHENCSLWIACRSNVSGAPGPPTLARANYSNVPHVRTAVNEFVVGVL